MSKADDHLLVGRYGIFARIASGGMATVHIGRLQGPVGFARTVAIKRLHASYANDPEFAAMLIDEARLVSRIQHHNVVPIIDVVAESGELLLVMEYVQGESLARLLERQRETDSALDPAIAVKILSDVLHGLHAAHEARNDRGEPLNVVHRDVSPQNILVGADGIARVIDFGIASGMGRMQQTRDDQIKGKRAYMSPEQFRLPDVDRRTDIYAASVVLWEALAGMRMVTGSDVHMMYTVLMEHAPAIRSSRPDVAEALDSVLCKGLEKHPDDRFATALELADALEAAIPPATVRQVAQWVAELAGETLKGRAKLVADVERRTHVSAPPAAVLGGTPIDAPEEATTGGTSQISVSGQGAKGRRWLLLAAVTIALAGAMIFLLRLTDAESSRPPGTSETKLDEAGARASDAPVVSGPDVSSSASPVAVGSAFSEPLRMTGSATHGASAHPPPRTASHSTSPVVTTPPPAPTQSEAKPKPRYTRD